MANNTAMTVRPQFNQHVANMGVDLNNNLGDNKARTGPENTASHPVEKRMRIRRRWKSSVQQYCE